VKQRNPIVCYRLEHPLKMAIYKKRTINIDWNHETKG
jgi:hypothetical protein